MLAAPNLHAAVFEGGASASCGFGFLRLAGISGAEAEAAAAADPLQAWQLAEVGRRRQRDLAAAWADSWLDYSSPGERAELAARLASHAGASTSAAAAGGRQAPPSRAALARGRAARSARLLVVDLAVSSPGLRRGWGGAALAAADLGLADQAKWGAYTGVCVCVAGGCCIVWGGGCYCWGVCLVVGGGCLCCWGTWAGCL